MPPTLTTIVSTQANSSVLNLTINTTAIGDVIVIGAAGNTQPPVTVNTTAATLLASGGAIAGDDALWYFVPSATGAQTIVSTRAGAARGMMIAAVWTGAESTTPVVSTANSSAASATSVSLVLSSAGADKVAIAAFAIGNANVSTADFTTGTGVIVDESVRMASAGSTQAMAMTHKAFSSATETLSMQYTTTDVNWDALGFVLAGSTGLALARGHNVSGWF